MIRNQPIPRAASSLRSGGAGVRWQSYYLERLIDAEDRFHELERQFDDLNGSLIFHPGVKQMLTIFVVNVGCLNISSRNELHEMVDDVV